MGQHEVGTQRNEREDRAFTQAILEDLRALEGMLHKGMFETGVQRVGAEQELALVDTEGRPAPLSTTLLERLDDDRFTTELARFNLEANLPPLPFGGDFLRRMEEQLLEVPQAVARVAEPESVRALLTGILPTLEQGDLDLHNMTPNPRYRQLNDGLLALGEGQFSIFIRGTDELELRPSTVMFEAANTSFQLHLQVEPGTFARLYNLAQLITAPLLAAAVNSPLLLGRRLWHETRMALFERSVDARSDAARARERAPRVSFGSAWVDDSVLELFKDTVARFPVVLTCDAEPSPVDLVEQGKAPKLSALMLHNGTVWRWNRPCYGVAGGVAHLRIENRVLPAGPTVLDQMANAALFYGAMVALDGLSADIPQRLPFDAAKGNFIQAARQGLGARLTWLDGRGVEARALLLEELIPAAREGLQEIGVPADDIERYLGTLEARVDSRRTGARWMLEALANTGKEAPLRSRLGALTRGLVERQDSGEPVHRWAPLEMEDGGPIDRPRTVGDIMSRDLFTVRPNDVVDLATRLMDWKHFRHVPVESTGGELVGLVSHRALLRLEEHRGREQSTEPLAVETIMDRNPPRVTPETPFMEGLQQLLSGDHGCLLVTTEGRLVGIATERDFLRAAALRLADGD